MGRMLRERVAEWIRRSPQEGWCVDRKEAAVKTRCVSFRDFMNVCLYDEQEGYYRSGPIRIGRKGDFYTSSGVGDVLAQSIARYTLAYLGEKDDSIDMMEWGAGTGRLSEQICLAGQSLEQSWKERINSVLIEDHPAHRQAAQERETARSGERDEVLAQVLTSERVWESTIWKRRCLVLANELLDAMPVHRVACFQGKLVELGVAWNEHEGLHEVYMPITDQRITQWLEDDGIKLREGQRTEVHADSAAFIARLGGVMSEGRMIIIDYGHEAAEYTATHRMDGTLLCYSQHIAHHNPYERIGEQDITSHVPFSFIRRIARASGWRTVSYMTQKEFLLEWGAFDLLQDHNDLDPFSHTAKRNRAVRQLLLSDHMSEAFKVLVLEKDV